MEKREMLVKEVMRTEPVKVRESTTLKELMAVFYKFTFHTIPVVRSDNKLVGIVALEDILKIFQPYPPHISEMLKRTPFLDVYEDIELLDADIPPEMGTLCIVKDLMNVNVVTIDKEAITGEALSLMKLHQLRRLPVVDKEGFLIGIISLFDIILAVFREKGVL
ncbi:MAG: CBS domain-containing protein [Candidatus Aerophobetes bacterium]|nr:CBS domain-containing protein [Candidatus Aerophobetes bacterium]